MAHAIRTHLMFEGAAEAAMKFYVGLFDGSAIERLERYDAAGPGAEGTVRLATFRLCGQELLCIDSPIHHDFTFTPAMSLFADCQSEAEIDRVFHALANGGSVLMPLGNYGFSARFGWVRDRFGVSWQLNLA